MSKSIRFITQQWTLDHIITCLSKTTWWPHIIMQALLLPLTTTPWIPLILTYPISFPPGSINSRCSGKWARTPFWDLQVYERVEDFIPNSIKVALVIGHWQLGIGRWAPGIEHLGLQNKAIICLSDYKTIATQCPITSAQSNLYQLYKRVEQFVISVFKKAWKG